jgi:hypothetical protein
MLGGDWGFRAGRGGPTPHSGPGAGREGGRMAISPTLGARQAAIAREGDRPAGALVIRRTYLLPEKPCSSRLKPPWRGCARSTSWPEPKCQLRVCVRRRQRTALKASDLCGDNSIARYRWALRRRDALGGVIATTSSRQHRVVCTQSRFHDVYPWGNE